MTWVVLVGSAISVREYSANAGSVSSMIWACSLTMTAAMSSVAAKNGRPSAVKKASDRFRSLTGRFTNRVADISGALRSALRGCEAVW